MSSVPSPVGPNTETSPWREGARKRALLTIVAGLTLFSVGCGHRPGGQDTASPDHARGDSGFDPTTPTGGIVEPGSAAELPPESEMEQVSFEEGEAAGPAERVRGAPERKDIPAFQLFGTRGEGPG